MAKERIWVVDENDNVITTKERGTLDHPHDIYRASCLWLMNSKGEFLLTQRSFNKIKDAGLWMPATSGTVNVDENYDSNIITETEEEIGLTNLILIKGKKILASHVRRFYIQYYYSYMDVEIDDLILQTEEVEQAKWFSKDDFLAQLNNNEIKITPAFDETKDYLLGLC